MTTHLSSQPRNTERCPLCGYLLEGLPDSGLCPECGQAYDQCQIIIEGWFADASNGAMLASRRPTLLVGMLFSGLCNIYIFWIALHGQLRWLACVPFVASIICYLLTRPKPEDVPPVQLILSPHGYLAQIHPAAKHLQTMQATLSYITVLPFILILLRNPTWLALIFLAMFALLPLVVTAVQKYFARRHRLPQATFDLSDLPLDLQPWKDNHEIQFKPLRSSAQLITIGRNLSRRKSFRLTFDSDRPTRVEADLSEPRLAHVTSTLAQWPPKLTILPRK
jgi:hypothetical protein